MGADRCRWWIGAAVAGAGAGLALPPLGAPWLLWPALALLWALAHHLIAGLRHVWMDATHSVSKAQGRSSAVVTLVASVLLTLALGARLFGLY